MQSNLPDLIRAMAEAKFPPRLMAAVILATGDAEDSAAATEQVLAYLRSKSSGG